MIRISTIIAFTFSYCNIYLILFPILEFKDANLSSQLDRCETDGNYKKCLNVEFLFSLMAKDELLNSFNNKTNSQCF